MSTKTIHFRCIASDLAIFQERLIMESCHSFIQDMLRHMGPTNTMDPRLQDEINNFPPEAKVGGIENYLHLFVLKTDC